MYNIKKNVVKTIYATERAELLYDRTYYVASNPTSSLSLGRPIGYHKGHRLDGGFSFTSAYLAKIEKMSESFEDLNVTPKKTTYDYLAHINFKIALQTEQNVVEILDPHIYKNLENGVISAYGTNLKFKLSLEKDLDLKDMKFYESENKFIPTPAIKYKKTKLLFGRVEKLSILKIPTTKTGIYVYIVKPNLSLEEIDKCVRTDNEIFEYMAHLTDTDVVLSLPKLECKWRMYKENYCDVNNAFKQGEVGHCDFPGNNGAGSRDVPKDIVSAGYLNIGEIWVLASATVFYRETHRCFVVDKPSRLYITEETKEHQLIIATADVNRPITLMK